MVSSYGIAAGASAAVCCYYLVRELKKCQGFLEFDKDAKSGGELVAEVLQAHGIKHLFVLSGGHVAPVYCAAEALGIEVVDVRHEVTSVFAADAAWRLTGRPGVACVTAGPGVTNTVTAVQNAKMAESAVVVLGGATGTILKGRGSLQDIDHMSLMKSIVKWSTTCNCVADIVPAVRKALHVCQSGIPGPVFVELPTDLLYPPSTVIQNVGKMMPRGRSLFTLLLHAFIHRHTNNLFVRASASPREAPLPVEQQPPSPHAVERTHALLAASLRPVLIIGSQSMQQQSSVGGLVAAVQALGVPVYTMGMARGLLGAPHADLPAPDGRQLLFRHKRADALKQADVVVLAGAVLDFRLQYGAAINPKAKLVVVNKSSANTMMNRPATVSVVGDPALLVMGLAERKQDARWPQHLPWLHHLRDADAAQEQRIRGMAGEEAAGLLNPLQVCLAVNGALTADSVLVLDGGDFVGTAAYCLRPRKALGWLDPGVFGTLGVGAGFALGAHAALPSALIWIMYGDGAFGFSVAELDTFVRHKVPVICVIGNDAGWTQILREQQTLLGRPTACELAHTDYHLVGEGFGAKGFVISQKEEVGRVVEEAKALARAGTPVVINCLIARNDFREGSISI